MHNYNNYIKCGEILKSPSPTVSDNYEFVFRCGCYEDHYIVLESFMVPPCSKNCKENVSFLDVTYKYVPNDIAKVDVPIKYENNVGVYDVDPLNVVKNSEPNEEVKKTEIKKETLLHETDEDGVYQKEDSQKDDKSSDDVSSEDENWENIESDNESVKSNDSNSPLFVDNFIKSEQNVLSLIEEYRSQTGLWNHKSPQWRLNKRHDKYLEKIKEQLKEKVHLEMSRSQIAAVITYLCRKYRQDLKRIKFGGESTDQKNHPAWFFPHLEFLKPVVEHNLFTAFTTSASECNFKPEQTIQVLGIYERFPHLWNTDLIENVCKNKRLEAIEQMQKVIEQEMGLQISEGTLQSNLQFIHNHFGKIKRCHLVEAKPKADKYFKHMQFLNDHIGPFQCPECAQIFKSPLTYKVHKSQHDGLPALRCSLCSKEYSNPGPYIAHARRHMNDLSEECTECGKKFLVASDLKIHMRSHTGAQPYCCEICGISFRHSTSLNVHRRRHEQQYLHKCPICSKGFYKKDRMNDHIRSHNNVRDFACKICNKAFKTRKTLKQHEVIHDDARNHACSLCGKAFKLKVGLLQHMRTHGGQI
ncbi:zinc finger protein 135 [Musca domestica]|uniref:Zinc finger protein 135 n=1 Tax=Musca domestica TaxID=7370 RepID=A0A1I8M2D1_MUSDO|nr:zinc finger protein 135 [Musca domestica]